MKMSEIVPFAVTWVDLDMIRLSEVSQRETYHTTSHMCNLNKKIQGNLFTK